MNIRSTTRRVALAALALAAVGAVPSAASAAAVKVVSYPGSGGPGPAKYNKVVVTQQGSPKAKHVLVLVPGTSGGAGYFLPLGADLVKLMPDWQVWSVDRRTNLLEDHSVLDKAIAGTATPQQLFDYYLGWIGGATTGAHFTPPADKDLGYVRDWGMKVTVEDLHKVIAKARAGGRKVVLGGHSLGGSIVDAYASWDFNGRAGARDLSGLVLMDGASAPGAALTKADATTRLAELQTSSPFLDLVGLGLPWATGVFAGIGSTLALKDPNSPALLQKWSFLPAALKPPMPATNLAGWGFAVDQSTGPKNLSLVQMHIGHLAAAGDPRGWVDDGLVTAKRAAQVFSGIKGVDGTDWYHARRLSLDAGVVNGGIRNPAQAAMGVRAWHGKEVKVPIYAFETSLGAGRVLKAARLLAKQSKLPSSKLKLVDRHTTYSHVDPVAAPAATSDFINTLVPFLKKQVK